MSTKLIQTRAIKQNPYKMIPSCDGCFKEATIEALIERENMIVVQRYCNSCLSKAEF